MRGVATERCEVNEAAAVRDVAPLVGAYLASAGGDPYQALADAIADALHELDLCAAALRTRERQVSAGYVRAGRSTPDRP